MKEKYEKEKPFVFYNFRSGEKEWEFVFRMHLDNHWRYTTSELAQILNLAITKEIKRRLDLGQKPAYVANGMNLDRKTVYNLIHTKKIGIKKNHKE